MKLQRSIKRLEAQADRLSRPILLEAPKLAETNRVLERRFLEGARPPEPEGLIIVAERVSNLIGDGRITEVTNRDWRKVAWCLWLEDRPLAHDQKVFDAYIGWLRHANRRSAYSSLISAYLREFDANDPSILRVAEELSDAVRRFDWHWQELHRSYRLFDPQEAPGRIATEVLAGDEAPSSILERVGLVGNVVTSGLGLAAFAEALQRFESDIAASQAKDKFLSRLLKWATVDEGFSFPSIRGSVADSLLKPWKADSSVPTRKIQTRTRDFMLRHFRDPRLHSGLWNDVDESALAVMLRWLAKASLEQFLQIVDDIASPELKLQWPYRRAFWEAYHRVGAIEEAWVAFADRGAQHARTAFEGNLDFGRLNRQGVQQTHAVLILKLANLTIAEWNENGKCHIWLPRNRTKPILYSPQYVRTELAEDSDNGGVIHAGSINGRWQQKVERFIRDKTGIRLSRTDYMPKIKA